MSRHTGKVPGTKKRPIPPHKQVCVIVGDMSDPVVAVAWSPHRSAPSDSGYTLLTSSAPPSPDEVGDDDAGTYCLACAAEPHPEATQGIELARAYGWAHWDDAADEWVAEDGEGNEIVFEDGDEPVDGQLTVDDILDEGKSE